MRIFVDTSAFIALADSDDEHHEKARKFYSSQIALETRFLTSNFVVCETLNYLRTRISFPSAVRFRESVEGSRIIEVHPITQAIEEKAFRIMKKFKDKAFSFTDCTSFALMDHLGIASAFGFDDHFRQYGRIVLYPAE